MQNESECHDDLKKPSTGADQKAICKASGVLFIDLIKHIIF